ncbi:hypothetical protein HZS_5040, partial [Henneguya salminicola]
MQGNLILKSIKNFTSNIDIFHKVVTYLKPCERDQFKDDLDFKKYGRFCYSAVRLYAEKLKIKSTDVNNYTWEIIIHSSNIFLKMFSKIEHKDILDFVKLLSFIIYEKAKKIIITDELYKIIKIYHSLLMLNKTSDLVQSSLTSQVILAVFCNSSTSIKKIEIEIIQLMLGFLDEIKIEKEAYQLSSLFLSQICHSTDQTYELKRTLQICIYFLQNYNCLKITQFLGYFLYGIYSSFSDKLLQSCKIDLLKIIMDLFLHCHLISKNSKLFLSIFQAISKECESDIFIIFMKIIKNEINYLTSSKILLIKLFNIYFNNNSNYKPVSNELNDIDWHIRNYFYLIEIKCLINYYYQSKDHNQDSVLIILKLISNYIQLLQSKQIDAELIKIYLKLCQFTFYTKNLNYSASTMKNLLKLIDNTSVSNIIKARCYYWSAILSYFSIVPKTIELTDKKVWHDYLSSGPVLINRSADHEVLSSSFLTSYFEENKNTKISESLGNEIVNLLFLLFINNKTSNAAQ